MGDSDFLEPRIGPDWASQGIGSFRDRRAFARFSAIYSECMGGLPEPRERLTVETAFGLVRAYRFGAGAGTPLLLMPGRGSSTPLWRANLPGLMRDRAVYTVDGLGEPGCSSQSARFRSARDQATAMHQTIEGLGLDGVHLLGASIGGWLALQTAIHQPDRVTSVITLDPASTFARLTAKAVVVSLGSVIPGMPDGLRNRLLGWISGGVEDAGDFPEGRLVASGMKDFKVRIPAPRMPTDGELRSVSLPVLVLIAGRSIMHNPDHAYRRATTLLPRGEVELWPDASHALNGEFPDRVAERVGGFLRAVESDIRPRDESTVDPGH